MLVCAQKEWEDAFIDTAVQSVNLGDLLKLSWTFFDPGSRWSARKSTS